jgi:plastocyanin
MSPNESNPDVQRAVEYLEDSDEPLDSKVSVVTNAANSADIPIDTILSEYADRLSANGVIYPMHESKLRELHGGVQQAVGEDKTGSLEDLCHPHTLIETKDDVVTEAINIYTSEGEKNADKQERIKTLIKDAQRDGIDINPGDVLRSLKEFSQKTDEDGDVSVEMEEDDDVTIVTGIETPDQVTAGEEYLYQVIVADDANLAESDWYIGGTKAGTGRTVLHTFEFPGIYTVSVEATDNAGETDHYSEEVEVVDPSTIELDISGDSTVSPGATTEYKAEVRARNETITGLQWELDSVPAGKGRTFSNTFEHDGEHTISVTATGESGITVNESKDITVQTPTGISVELDMPDDVYVDEKTEIGCSIDAENSAIDSTTFKIGDEVIPIEQSSSIVVEHIFTEPGEYPVTITATNTGGETDTSVATVNARVRPEVELVEHPESVIRGDSESFTVEFDDRLSSRWGVNDASLTHVGERTAQVTFNSGLAENARVSIEVENDAGETASDSATVSVNQPTVDTVIDFPDVVTVDELVEFSAKNTEATDADITRIEWTLGDGEVIGRGETVTHSFPGPGEYSVSATTHTNRDVGDTETVTVRVEPDTDLTAVIVTRGGPTTRDEFVLDGSKSRATNTGVRSYTWDIEGHDEVTGETAEIRFESPGEYNVELTVESDAGDVDTDTTTLTVEQYTAVTATIDGPSEFGVGEPIEFSGKASVPINTQIVEYEWFLNDQPVGSGDEFTQTFSKPGHYTIGLEVTTATDDVDKATQGVIAESPESTITPDFELKLDKDPAVGEPVTITAAPTEVENGTLRACEWVVDGDELGNTTAVIGISFDEIGETEVELKVTASDGVNESVSKSIYVTPAISDPPYTPVTTNSEMADVFGTAVEIYQNDVLTTSDKNRFAAHLVKDAQNAGIYVDSQEVEAHLEDIEAVDSDIVDIDEGSVASERKYRFIDDDVDVSEKYRGKTDTASWDATTDTGAKSHDSVTELEGPGADPFGIDENDDEDTATDDTNDADTDSLAHLDLDSESSDDNSESSGSNVARESPISDATFGVTEPDPGELDDESEDGSEDTGSGEDDSDDLDEIPSVDEDDIDERHTTERISPETFDLGDSIFSMPNYAQDLMDFEYIMGEDDELVPEDVNGAGIVVAENGLYIAIARVQGRDWSIHTGEKQRDIVQTYQSHFLSALDSPVQMVSIPTRFDMREHISNVNDVLSENSDDSDELLMNIGRSIYPNWLEDFMIQNDMKERQFYLVATVSAEQLHRFKGDGESLVDQLQDIPVIGGFFDRFSEDKVEDITKYQCLRELNTRMNRMKSGLRRMDVGVERIDSRNEAMAVLYHYFHNIEPDREVFPTGPFTTTHQNGSIGGISVDHLFDEHVPAHGGLDGEEGDQQ